VNWRIITDV